MSSEESAPVIEATSASDPLPSQRPPRWHHAPDTSGFTPPEPALAINEWKSLSGQLLSPDASTRYAVAVDMILKCQKGESEAWVAAERLAESKSTADLVEAAITARRIANVVEKYRGRAAEIWKKALKAAAGTPAFLSQLRQAFFEEPFAPEIELREAAPGLHEATLQDLNKSRIEIDNALKTGDAEALAKAMARYRASAEPAGLGDDIAAHWSSLLPALEKTTDPEILKGLEAAIVHLATSTTPYTDGIEQIPPEESSFGLDPLRLKRAAEKFVTSGIRAEIDGRQRRSIEARFALVRRRIFLPAARILVDRGDAEAARELYIRAMAAAEDRGDWLSAWAIARETNDETRREIYERIIAVFCTPPEFLPMLKPDPERPKSSLDPESPRDSAAAKSFASSSSSSGLSALRASRKTDATPVELNLPTSQPKPVTTTTSTEAVAASTPAESVPSMTEAGAPKAKSERPAPTPETKKEAPPKKEWKLDLTEEQMRAAKISAFIIGGLLAVGLLVILGVTLYDATAPLPFGAPTTFVGIVGQREFIMTIDQITGHSFTGTIRHRPTGGYSMGGSGSEIAGTVAGSFGRGSMSLSISSHTEAGEALPTDLDLLVITDGGDTMMKNDGEPRFFAYHSRPEPGPEWQKVQAVYMEDFKQLGEWAWGGLKGSIGLYFGSAIIIVIAHFWILVIAFTESPGWGCLTFFFPLPFMIMHFDKCKVPTMMIIAGIIMVLYIPIMWILM